MAPKLPTPPATLDDFKKRFGARDFKFGTGPDTVMDADVANAMQDALAVFNPRLFGVADGWAAFLYLTAHYVRTNVEAVGGLQAEPEGLGVENQGEQLLASAGVSGVQQSFVEPPERVKRNPIFLQLWVTTYGQKYVAMALLKTTGAVGVVDGPRDFDTFGRPQVPFANF